MDGLKDSLLHSEEEEKGAPAPPVAPVGRGHDAASCPHDAPKTADPKPQS